WAPIPSAPAVPEVTGAVPALAVGDFRGDGKQDIVANASGNLDVLLGNGDGTFGAPGGLGPITFGVGAGIGAMVVGDFTGDGKLDIVTSNFPAKSTSGPTLPAPARTAPSPL